MNQEHSAQLARDIFDTSNIRGRFILRSGAVSDEYFDKYLFEGNPDLLRRISEAMQSLLPDDVGALAGLEMGGIPLAVMLSQLTKLPTLFIRKEAKTYGTCKLAEGGELNNRKIVLVEDVVTSGGAVMDAAAALRGQGAQLEHVLCVIDREADGRQRLADQNLTLHALFTMSELNAHGSAPC